MEQEYKYFKRDISWLSFNYRILLEAEDETLPIYERIRFLSIYSSNLEEFYEIRVAEHRGVIMKKNYTEESGVEAEETLAAITREVNRQQREYYRIFSKILPELNRQDIYLYQDSTPEPFHADFVRNYFNEEVFPFLSPVMIQAGDIRTFIRDRRLYLVVRMTKKNKKTDIEDASTVFHYALMKIPHAKVPRFIELPSHEGKYYIMFSDDMIRENLSTIFPGYEIDSCYSIKISRDADIYLEETAGKDIIEDIRKKVKKRKIGDLSRFMYDRAMPDDFLSFVCDAFGIHEDDLVVGGRYLNLQDLATLPNPRGKMLEQHPPIPMRVPFLDEAGSVFKAIKKRRDVLLHFPYQSFDYLIRFLMEAAFDPKVEAIKITQYRVAENSAVINTLISAAQNGKQVTVFVELKARFDEENNMSTAERMKQAGIRIIYSIPGLKVHAKVAVILRKPTAGKKRRDYAYLSTGNFNEKTARIYSDMALLTNNQEIIEDINRLFAFLEGTVEKPFFRHLLVARFNMVSGIKGMIDREIEHVRNGKRGRIVLKMNGLHDREMINELYRASESGVEIDLIVRGICCLVPNQPYSQNIRITRIVDMFLEHSRIWYFYNDGREDLYLSSADWMRRNLNRRIETAFPVLDVDLKKEIINILQIQLRDNTKACFIDENLCNNFKRDNGRKEVRAQLAIYDYLKDLVSRS